MEKLKNATIIRVDKKESGNFVQTSKAILTNEKLTDSAVRLLQLMLDTHPNAKISLTYYRKLLSWSKDKLASAVSNLKENGFLKVKKQPKGKGNGYSYHYTISEFGNLINDEENQEFLEEVSQSSNDKQDNNNVDFYSYLKTLGDLIDYYGENFVDEGMPFYNTEDIKGLERVTTKYLKQFYNDEIGKVKAPDKNSKAYKALQNWLKDEVFNKKNLLNLYTERYRNINAKYLMYKMKYQPVYKTDWETEMAERTND